MKPIDKIIMYMEAKADLTDPIYFTPKDEENLRKHSEYTLSKVWKRIKGLSHALRFSTEDCPFCIIHNDLCIYCEYGDVHGRCNASTSDWTKFIAPKISRGDVEQKLGEIVEFIKSIKHLE